VCLDGAKIGTASLHARPGPACLELCGLEGPGLAECVAGEVACFGIHVRDAQGHTVAAAPAAAFSVEVSSGEERCIGALQPWNPALRLCKEEKGKGKKKKERTPHAGMLASKEKYFFSLSRECKAWLQAQCYLCVWPLLAGAVKDKGRGLLEVAYTLQTAGPFSIAVSLAGASAPRSLCGVCHPARLCLAQCIVLEHAPALAAGQEGTLLIKQADR
jgi:hypothetical protein